jgi:hypothetical protein
VTYTTVGSGEQENGVITAGVTVVAMSYGCYWQVRLEVKTKLHPIRHLLNRVTVINRFFRDQADKFGLWWVFT